MDEKRHEDPDSPNRVKVWDPFVRIFHWIAVALLPILLLTAYAGMQEAHMELGVDLLVLVAARLAWGVVGTTHARFAGFITGPRASLAYLRDVLRGRPRRYLGHNPAGALMVLALLLVLAVLLLSGLVLQATLEFDGPLVDPFLPAGDAFVEAVREVHHGSVQALYGLVPLHLIGVLLASMQHRENLPWSMVTGYKFMHDERRKRCAS